MGSPAKDWIYPHAMRLVYLVWLNVPALRPVADRVMQRVFDAAAPQWDAYNTDPNRLVPLLTAIDRLPEAPQRVLDMGCGNGRATIQLADRLPGAWIFGIDVSEEMIAAALAKASAAGSSARFAVGRIQQSGLASEKFDLVVLVNVPPPFNEVHRVLKPGGHAVVVFTQGPQTWFYSSAARLERGFRRHGMLTLAHGPKGRGEFFITAKR